MNVNYWKKVKPSYMFLKEHLRGKKREVVESWIGDKIDRNELDPYVINEAYNFLKLSIINLLAYKHLVCSNYLAWAKVALYYSYFYIINSLLRLQKFAIVHINYVDDRPLTIIIDRCQDRKYYNIKNARGNQHDLIWKTFEQYYPHLMSEGIGKLFREDRTEWNYDLFYMAQSTMKHAIEEAETRCKHNYISPVYGMSHNPEAEEYFADIMSNIGWEEAGVGELIEYTIDEFKKIGYTGFCDILQDLKTVEAPDTTKDVIRSWLKK